MPLCYTLIQSISQAMHGLKSVCTSTSLLLQACSRHVELLARYGRLRFEPCLNCVGVNTQGAAMVCAPIDSPTDTRQPPRWASPPKAVKSSLWSTNSSEYLALAASASASAASAAKSLSCFGSRSGTPSQRPGWWPRSSSLNIRSPAMSLGGQQYLTASRGDSNLLDFYHSCHLILNLKFVDSLEWTIVLFYCYFYYLFIVNSFFFWDPFFWVFQ